MAEEIRRIDYFSIPIANKVGEGARVLGALRDAGANFVGVWGYSTSPRQGRLELLPDDSTGFPKIAKKAGVKAGKKQPAFLVSGDDRPGVVAELLAKLAAAGINVEAIKATCSGGGRFAGAIFVDPKDAKKAGKALGA